jgi:biopolymer transport protein ExbD
MSVIPKRRRRKAEINIVPLVDVLVVLIFFFLVSMQFRNLNLLNLTLPEIETAGKSEPETILRLAVDVEGQFFINGEAATDAEVIAFVERTGLEEPGIPVVIMADENSLLGKVTFLMDTCRKAGLEKVRLQAR